MNGKSMPETRSQRGARLAVRVLSGGAERASGSAAGGNACPKASEKREWNREKNFALMPDGMGRFFIPNSSVKGV